MAMRRVFMKYVILRSNNVNNLIEERNEKRSLYSILPTFNVKKFIHPRIDIIFLRSL
jgi:hypothetical protein